MPIKEALVKTAYVRGFETYDVPVFYTDELIETSVYDLAYSSEHGEYLPYLFIGFFKNEGEKNGKWFISNARRHDDMKQAVIKDIGEVSHYTYGQLMFSSRARANGRLIVDQIILREISESNEERLEELTAFLNKLSDDILPVGVGVYDATHYNGWFYIWDKSEHKLKKVR